MNVRTVPQPQWSGTVASTRDEIVATRLASDTGWIYGAYHGHMWYALTVYDAGGLAHYATDDPLEGWWYHDSTDDPYARLFPEQLMEGIL